MFLRFTNSAILALIGLLTLTGLYGIVFTLHGWVFEIHRVAGWALIALIPWKAIISLRSLRRGLNRRFDRSVVVGVSVLLGALTLLVLGLGLTWAWRLSPGMVWLGQYGDTAISWHWMLALGLLPLFALHAWRRWPRPRRSDFTSRRAVLQMLGIGAAGIAGWWAAESLARVRASPEAPRRFTGSREQSSFSGNAFPITNSLGEGKIVLDPASWTLALGGAGVKPYTMTYGEVLALPAIEKVATIDCTTGWYSTQVWRGVPLLDLLDRAGLRQEAGVVRLRAASGYFGDFTLSEAREILLATHVGGEVLQHWHGFPLRAVVPSRRGWFWVKWLTGMEVLAAHQASASERPANEFAASQQ